MKCSPDLLNNVMGERSKVSLTFGAYIKPVFH